MKLIKLSGLIFATLISSTTFARAPIGTKATSIQNWTVDGLIRTVEDNTMLLEYRNDGTAMVLVTGIVNYGEDTLPLVISMDAGIQKLMSAAELQVIVDSCSEQGGTPETVTVPMGTFPTCRHDIVGDSDSSWKNGSIWTGVVPMSVVKVSANLKNGFSFIQELSSAQWGP